MAEPQTAAVTPKAKPKPVATSASAFEMPKFEMPKFEMPKMEVPAAFREVAEKLVRAKDAQELTALHTDYVKSQIAALTDQAKELSKQAAKLAGQH